MLWVQLEPLKTRVVGVRLTGHGVNCPQPRSRAVDGVSQLRAPRADWCCCSFLRHPFRWLHIGTGTHARRGKTRGEARLMSIEGPQCQLRAMSGPRTEQIVY